MNYEFNTSLVQYICISHLERLRSMVGQIEGQGLLQESETDVILAHSMQDKPNVGVNEGQLRVILSSDQEGQKPGSVEQLQGRAVDTCVFAKQ